MHALDTCFWKQYPRTKPGMESAALLFFLLFKSSYAYIFVSFEIFLPLDNNWWVSVISQSTFESAGNGSFFNRIISFFLQAYTPV